MAWDWDPTEDDTAGWRRFGTEGLMRELPEGEVLEVWGNRFKSSSPDCEAFIHDPLTAMLKAEIPHVSPESRVTSFVINHDKTLSKFQLYAFAIVSAGSVGLTLYKVPPPETKQS